MVANSCNFSEKLIAKINSFVRFYVTYLLHSMNIPELHPCLFLFLKTCISLIALTQQTFVLVRTYWRRLQEVLKTSSRGLERQKVLRWRRLEDILGRPIGNTSWRRLQEVLEDENCYAEDVLKTSWRRLGKQDMFAGKCVVKNCLKDESFSGKNLLTAIHAIFYRHSRKL